MIVAWYGVWVGTMWKLARRRAHAVPTVGDVTVLKEAPVVEEKVITKRVGACTAQICEIAGVRPDGPTGQWIAELVQNCCEEELDEALEEA
jgi:hypothetical protein